MLDRAKVLGLLTPGWKVLAEDYGSTKDAPELYFDIADDIYAQGKLLVLKNEILDNTYLESFSRRAHNFFKGRQG